MICRNCMTRLPFLWFYNKTSDEQLIIKKSETDEDVDILSTNTKQELSPKSGPSMAREVDSGIENSCDSVVNSSAKASQCKLKTLKSELSGESGPPDQLTPTFWSLEWRTNLCKCKDCMDLYVEKKCLFLTDEKDMVHYYEREGMQSNTRVSDYDKGLSELKKMNRIQQIEYINGYNELQDSLKEFLKTFADSKRTVREEDIKGFFEEMSARKRQKVDIPYTCK